MASSAVAGVHEESLPSSRARRKAASAVANAMLEAFSFNEDSTLVMDYACGSGALSQRLAPYSKIIIGVDIDPNAVENYNAKVANQGITSEEMRAICVNLQNRPAELEGQQFDVIVCSQAYHHFPSINETARLLTALLKPQTGMLLVSDLLKGPHAKNFRQPSKSTDSHQNHHHTVVHRGGLTEREVRESFEHAGLISIDFEVIETIVRNGRELDIFLAQGVRPLENT